VNQSEAKQYANENQKSKQPSKEVQNKKQSKLKQSKAKP
jgi:hypothetical protein